MEKTLGRGQAFSSGVRLRHASGFPSARRPRISAGQVSHLGGSASLANWRGSRLQTVYRGIEIGTEVGKYRASFAGLGLPTFGLVRRVWFGDSNPSINTHGVGTYKYSSVASWAARGKAVRLSKTNSAISVRPALVANSLCRGREKRTMRESEGQIGNSGLDELSILTSES